MFIQPSSPNYLPQEHEMYQGYEREAPLFADQVADTTRTELITSVVDTPVTEAAASAKHTPYQITLSEHDSLVALDGFLAAVAQLPPADTLPPGRAGWRDAIVAQAMSMRQNQMYIGATELDEAATGIANRLRERLAANPELQICIPASSAPAPGKHYKSSAYVLDAVLGKFDESEQRAYGNRLIVDMADITATGDNLAVILLQDFTMTGTEMGKECAMLLKEHPEYASSMEIQLIAAAKHRINSGLRIGQNELWAKIAGLQTDYHFPVSAYFAANDVFSGAAPDAGVHIASSWSSPKLGFRNLILNMVDYVRTLPGMDAAVPPLADVMPPYRADGYRPAHLERFRSASGVGA